MIDIENSEHRATLMADLQTRMRRVQDGHNSTNDLLHKYRDLFYDFRIFCKNRYGVEFPRMVAIVLPSLGEIEFVRADLDNASVQATVINITTKFPHVSMTELVLAILKAFPNYGPQIQVPEPRAVH